MKTITGERFNTYAGIKSFNGFYLASFGKGRLFMQYYDENLIEFLYLLNGKSGHMSYARKTRKHYIDGHFPNFIIAYVVKLNYYERYLKNTHIYANKDIVKKITCQ